MIDKIMEEGLDYIHLINETEQDFNNRLNSLIDEILTTPSTLDLKPIRKSDGLNAEVRLINARTSENE